MESIKLTQFSKGSGCGCKIAPAQLEEILAGVQTSPVYSGLLLGNESRDDAAVFDQGDGTAIVSTTDFFTPIIDDASAFGQIAAANAINDIYAMGGKPLMAIAILGWPVEKLSPSLAGDVLEGGRHACEIAGIPLAGGHSIDAPEPFFGLAVTGKVDVAKIKYNDKVKEGDVLFLTKPLGVGIISTAQKRGKADVAHVELIMQQMKALNTMGADIAELDYVHAMTDVTGFGLLGHLIEMCADENIAAQITYDKVPILDILDPYLKAFIMPDNTMRNFKAYGEKVSTLQGAQLLLLCDPQTSGGLMVAVDPTHASDFKAFYQKKTGVDIQAFGQIVKRSEKVVEVI